MTENKRPRFWTDFDGTAVEIVKKTNPRNWSKYPLKAIEGFADFLVGVDRGGLEVVGTVSRRPNIAPRRYATQRSISKLGLEALTAVVLSGSEERKGQFIANQSRTGKVAFADDKPHKVGPAIISGLIGNNIPMSGQPHANIVLGAVDHARTDEYLERFVTTVESMQETLPLDESVGLMLLSDDHICMRGLSGFTLDVVRLNPYSEQVGQEFAQAVLNTEPFA